MMVVKMVSILKIAQCFSFALVTQNAFALTFEMTQLIPLPI
jgi:hypothetical protein